MTNSGLNGAEPLVVQHSSRALTLPARHVVHVRSIGPINLGSRDILEAGPKADNPIIGTRPACSLTDRARPDCRRRCMFRGGA